MNRLSQEVVDMIAGYLPNRLDRQSSNSALAPYATISRAWKRAVEKTLFESISFKNDELGELAVKLNSNGGRWGYVRKLTYKILAAPDPTTRRKSLNVDMDFWTRMVALMHFINHHWASKRIGNGERS